MRRSLWVGAVAFVAAAAISFGQLKPAFAYLFDREFEDHFIEPFVSISYDGYWAWVAGYVACTEDERVEINVWVVQPFTGAEAEGSWHNTCTGESQPWYTSSIPSQNAYPFEEGPAEVCATAWTRSNSGTTDIFQGCSEADLTPTA